MHGPIEFDGANIEDFVILRSDGHPTYQLSVVSDDVEMKITHVVRGDDHISNTPKQILLYRAIGADVPQFAHVPLILGPDKKRLSKRHGATSVMEYARQGYLPEAMVNFLALLGWSPGAAIASCLRATSWSRAFALDGISGGNAVFNPEKLDWFNQQHMARLAPDRAGAPCPKPLFEAAGLWNDEYLGDRHAWFFAVLELLKPRVEAADDFVEQGRFFFTDAIEYDRGRGREANAVEGMREHLAALDAGVRRLDALRCGVARSGAARDGRGVRCESGALIHAIRVAVTGKAVSPGLFEVLALLGRERVHERLLAGVRLAASLSASRSLNILPIRLCFPARKSFLPRSELAAAETVFLSACDADGYTHSVAYRLQPKCLNALSGVPRDDTRDPSARTSESGVQGG